MLKTAAFLALLQLCSAQQLDWPKTYTVSGQIILPYGDILEPFTAYVDMTGKGRSRIDYYEGTAVILNLGDQGPNGTMYKIVPETTKDHANVPTCMKLPGISVAPVNPQGVLPDTSLYRYVADTPYKGMTTEVYLSSFVQEEKINNYTLMVRKDDKSPVLLRFVGYDRLFGSHYDEYVLEYTGFSTTFKPSVFDYANNFQCKEPSVAFSMAENPMFEFVGAPKYQQKHQTHKVDSDFEEFKGRHGREYESEKEEAKRKMHFRHNHRYIHSMNRRDLPYKLKVNHMTDYSDEEFTIMRGYRHTPNAPRGKPYEPTIKDVPTFFNWRLRGAVTPVKDQGICGSCWSFSTTGTIEGSYFIKNGMKNLRSFSEQALVDCSWGYGNNGCDGGLNSNAYQWIIDNGCLPLEEFYGIGRYLMQDGKCMVNTSVCGVKLSGFTTVPQGNESALVMAIADNGPIGVAIDASHKSFSFYSHGVYYEPACGNTPDDLDHAVLAVGYGTLNAGDPNSDYWYIKNSWSTHWGNDGYVLMSRRDNNCGVATDATFAQVMV